MAFIRGEGVSGSRRRHGRCVEFQSAWHADRLLDRAGELVGLTEVAQFGQHDVVGVGRPPSTRSPEAIPSRPGRDHAPLRQQHDLAAGVPVADEPQRVGGLGQGVGPGDDDLQGALGRGR